MKAILTYHSIDGSGSAISLDRQTFVRHAAWLAGAGLRSVALDVLVSLPAGEAGVAITFDDGFANFATEAWPVLREHGHAVTLFVPTGHVGDVNAWEAAGRQRLPILPLLNWAQLGRLAAEGVHLGSHGVSHRRLTELSDLALRDEVESSATMLLQETGVEPSAFAYPYGVADARVADRVGARYRLAVTTEYRTVGPGEDSRRLPRLDTFYLRRPGRIERWGTPGLRSAIAVRRQLRRIRRFVTDGV